MTNRDKSMTAVIAILLASALLGGCRAGDASSQYVTRAELQEALARAGLAQRANENTAPSVDVEQVLRKLILDDSPENLIDQLRVLHAYDEDRLEQLRGPDAMSGDGFVAGGSQEREKLIKTLEGVWQAVGIRIDNLSHANALGFKRRDVLEVTPENGMQTAFCFSQGNLVESGEATDIAISGEGFFQIRQEHLRVYTRRGNFAMDADRRLALLEGRLDPEIAVPDNASQIEVKYDGRVLALLPGEAEPTVIGQVELARFRNPSGLVGADGVFWTASVASGDAIVASPASVGMGCLFSGFLESANVEPMIDALEIARLRLWARRIERTLDLMDDAVRSEAKGGSLATRDAQDGRANHSEFAE